MSTSTETRNEQTTTREPYKASRPLLQRLANTSMNIAENPAMFRNSFGADTLQGFQNYRDIASKSQPAYGVGINEIISTARGDNLYGNPYYRAALDDSLDRVEDRVNQQFSAAGRYGSGAYTRTLTDRLGEAEIAAMRDNYNFERGNQINAANLGLSAGVQGAGLLDMVGQRQDALTAANKLAPATAAQTASGIGLPVASMFGATNSSGVSTQETPANVPGMVLGGLTAGAGLMTGNPMAAMGGLSGMVGGGAGGGWGGLNGFNQGVQGMHSPSFWSPAISHG